MNYNKSFFGLFLALLVLLPGCILHVPSYHRQKLRLVRDNCTYSGIEKNVTLQAKLLTESDKQDLFGEHIGHIEGDDIKVMYLSIHNLSDKDYFFKSDCIDLKQLSSRNVVKAMKKTSSIGKLSVAGLGGGLYALCYGMWQALLSPILIIPFGLPMIGCIVGGTAAVTLGSIQGIRSIVMNRRINKDLKDKTLHERVIINSGDCYEGLMFVKSSDYKPQFNVTMYEQNKFDERITFDVDLRQNE